MTATTLKQLQDRVQNLINQQGEDAPVAAFIFTNEDVFVLDEEGEPQYQPIDIVNQVLGALEDSDGLYEEIFSHIDFELQSLKLIK